MWRDSAKGAVHPHTLFPWYETTRVMQPPVARITSLLQSYFLFDLRLLLAFDESPGEWSGRNDSLQPLSDYWLRLRLGFTLEMSASYLNTIMF